MSLPKHLPCSILAGSQVVSAHPNARPVVKFTGISVAIPTIEENRLNKLALRVTIGVSPQSDAVSGSELWQLNVWGSRKANGNGYRYSNTEQALNPQQTGLSVTPPNDLFFEYVRFDLDMTRARCDNIAYICAAITTSSTSFDLRGEPNEGSLVGCTTVTCQGKTMLFDVLKRYSFNLVYSFWGKGTVFI